MLSFMSGYFSEQKIPEERVLFIKTMEYNGSPLKNAVQEVLKTYSKKDASVVCFVGGEDSQAELRECCSIIHEANRKTGFKTELTDLSMLNKRLEKELDFLCMGKSGFLKREYCDFADVYDWVNV